MFFIASYHSTQLPHRLGVTHMAPSPEEGGSGLDERQRVLIHACSLNRSDIIKKVVSPAPRSSSSANGGDGEVDRGVLDHVDEGGLTALHHAVKKSSLDVSFKMQM